jgi:hypothetical protein
VIVILKLIYSFTVLNYGPKILAGLAVLRTPKSLMEVSPQRSLFEDGFHNA